MTSREQRFTGLTAEDRARLDEQRAIVRGYVREDPRAPEMFTCVEGRLAALQAILDAGVVPVGETYALQALGIVLGDALVERLGLVWIIVEDEYGRDPAVRLPGSRTLAFPLTMISKRVEAGERVDVASLFVKTVIFVEAERQKLGL